MNQKTKGCLILLAICIITSVVGGITAPDGGTAQVAGLGAAAAFVASLFAIFMEG